MSEVIHILKAKSSSGDFYEVRFKFFSGLISVSCFCIAGSLNQMCKHKEAFLNNDRTMLFDQSENELLSTVYDLICTSNFPAEFAIYQAALDDIENQKKELGKQAKQVKGMFGRRLSEGI